MTQHLVIIHGTDKSGGHWYAPLFVRHASTIEEVKAEAAAALEVWRHAGDPKGQGQIGGIFEVPPESTPAEPPAIERTGAGLAGEAMIRVKGY